MNAAKEMSSHSARMHFANLLGERSHQLCLINVMEAK